MSLHAETIRMRLFGGPLSARQISEIIGVSQPTISRALTELGDEIVRIGAARSIQYTLRDATRGLSDFSVYRVDAEGRIRQLGMLIPVRPEGFVMCQENGVTLHSDGLPWWLFDMRPQGYLGRAYAARHGAELGLPERLKDWADTHALRALLVHGHDVVGNLLLGDIARDRFLAASIPDPIEERQKAVEYTRLAIEAARGEKPGSSAGGEQPKFTTFAITSDGPRHVIVKFSEMEESPVSERWRDLLLAEHLALDTLREAGIPAAQTRIVDHGNQRFLEAERFDRIGNLGRRALCSLAALDAEFVGAGTGGWPIIARRLAADGQIRQEAADRADLLWAFGALIGNTDMHSGNLSFVSEHGRPYDIAPAYDMTSMTFAPRSGGGLPSTVSEASICASVTNETWRYAEQLARVFLAQMKASTGFSHRFGSCIAALEDHIKTASAKIDRLG
ncbi:MAG: type II toxin-antitoxin system HipA family toxin YjjJ [Nitrosomonas sp.]|uniref:type II toxin-antitoxin system HipA family toxin YjjJ n=1 Tax=Nitrosomonas sp. TaxID=42353 RepID=UPI0027375E3E|nr:type II toxin-antitoxin system HipA family toxin YjjJ [Nitrosomonas sp.]MDP3664706.1 type II toxin-antitoxin system HipA family toxin YjjJ [Nitrosomonas sp.]MDZ4105167.1 type II toxin-antitoxin system HipA family toxin YjjJ [Nitrosomonas sp.]